MGQHKLSSSYTSTLCCDVTSAGTNISQNHSTFIFTVVQPTKRSHALQLDSVYYTAVNGEMMLITPTGSAPS